MRTQISKETLLTQIRLKELLTYDPNTGVFTWNIQRSSGVKARDVAGTRNKNGYIVISVDGVDYLAHRLVWLYMFGVWPNETIDHKFGERSDNRLSELRPLPIQLNGANRTRANKSNSSGLLGAHKKRDGSYASSIRVNNKLISLGSYDSAKSATLAHAEAQSIYFPEIFASGPTPILNEYAEKQASKLKESAITYKGETKSPREWAIQFGVRPRLLRQRINRDGMSFELAIRCSNLKDPKKQLKDCNAD